MSNSKSSNNASDSEEDNLSCLDEDFLAKLAKLTKIQKLKKSKKEKQTLQVYPCDECKMEFEYANLLTRHKVKHARMKLKISCHEPDCKHNDYFFSTKQTYTRHMLTVHNIE